VLANVSKNDTTIIAVKTQMYLDSFVFEFAVFAALLLEPELLSFSKAGALMQV